MASDLNEMMKQVERVPLGCSNAEILFEALQKEWAAFRPESTVDLFLGDMCRDNGLHDYD